MELTFKSCKHQVGAAHYIAFAENYSTIFKSDIYTDNEHAYQGLDLTANHGTVDILANKVCSWSIGGIPKDKAPYLTRTLMLEAGFEKLHVFPTFVGSRVPHHGYCSFWPENR
ncbi:AP-3 complex subunit mu-like isoform X1 [Chenopodium quinoa]|uniref:AP-3 complex subunit mu-like isoform X1 n=1 Tax=Chenopodium quinoa TaxID=63459 RepID=UPI000B76C9B9|nr:AP-3 complex subunit mu-like isoform X1 [Chenopodium quinoa]